MLLKPFNLKEPIEIHSSPAPMDDTRTRLTWLEAKPTKLRGAIVVPEITAENIELKHPRFGLRKNLLESIQTWDASCFESSTNFFPPSKTTILQMNHEISTKNIDERFRSMNRFNDLLRACPHHGFSELHQLDTFYNALNYNDQDSLNSAAGGNFLDKMPRDCLRIIESKSKVRNSRNKPVVAKVSSSTSTPGISSDVAELKDMVKALLLDKKNQSPDLLP
ncbi:hypothetical protein Tco_1209335 [Tanacetum coccineum]